MGLGRERRKEEGGDWGTPWPVAQRRATCHHGHCHDPPATPTHRDGAGQGPGYPLGGTCLHKLDLDLDFASSRPALPPPFSMPSLLVRSGLPTGKLLGVQGEIRAPLYPGKL